MKKKCQGEKLGSPKSVEVNRIVWQQQVWLMVEPGLLITENHFKILSDVPKCFVLS